MEVGVAEPGVGYPVKRWSRDDPSKSAWSAKTDIVSYD
jgi:hypothetical protein